MISFAITSHNEGNSLRRLLNQILKYKKEGDEIVIVDDYSDNSTAEILYEYCQINGIEYYQHHLNGDFAEQKNYLKSLCKNSHIVSFDADEYANDILMSNIHEIIELNNDVDVIWVPRINIVDGIEMSHVKKWGWQISKMESQINEKIMSDQSNEYQLLKLYNLIIEENLNSSTTKYVKFYMPIIQFPDLQQKIFKNIQELKWVGKVHERLEGGNKISQLPFEEKYCYYHYKTIEKQKLQNKLYEKILK